MKPKSSRTGETPPLKSWGVFVLRKKAQRIGSAKAKDQKEALEKAFAKLQITPHERVRVSVLRE